MTVHLVTQYMYWLAIHPVWYPSPYPPSTILRLQLDLISSIRFPVTIWVDVNGNSVYRRLSLSIYFLTWLLDIMSATALVSLRGEGYAYPVGMKLSDELSDDFDPLQKRTARVKGLVSWILFDVVEQTTIHPLLQSSLRNCLYEWPECVIRPQVLLSLIFLRR